MEPNILMSSLQAAFAAAVDSAVQAKLAPLLERMAALETKLEEEGVELTDLQLKKVAMHLDLSAVAGEIDLSSLASEISASDVADNFSASDIAEEVDIEGAIESFFSSHRLRVC